MSVLSTDVVIERAKCEELEKVIIGDDEEKFFEVRVQMPPQEKEKLMIFFKKNVDVFVLSAYKALRVDLDFICHRLNVNPSVIPKKQPH